MGALALAAVLAELVVIAAGCNQWVTSRVVHYAGGTPRPGFLHQFVYSTQTMAWRLGNSSGQTNANEWVGSLVRVAVAVVLTGALVALTARRGSFWRAGVAAMLAVVFATVVAQIVERVVYAGPSGSFDIGISSPYPASDARVGQYLNLTLTGSTGGGRVTTAVFGGPTGYSFMGGVVLGVLVGIVVGIVASRLGNDRPEPRLVASPAPQAPAQTFFPPGEMQRGYEENAALQPPDAGRHSLD